MMVLSLAPLSFSADAREFITIIGPDGRPMVVPRVQEKSKKTTEKNQSKNIVSALQTTKAIPGKTEKAIKPIDMAVNTVPSVSSTSAQIITELPLLEKISVQTSVDLRANGFSEVDGEQYVDSEYLEGKEFNLEGKKRFYSMPEGVMDKNLGSTRIQTVEREKGIGQSALKNLFQRSVIDDSPVVLSPSYYRVSQEETAYSLGQQCFKDKQMKKAKKIALNKQVNLWPRAPIAKDKFDFELLKVQGDIQNIQIKSFASKQNAPTFYWPFVVFLDEKGCVLEGAGGFKSQESNANLIQYANIEGIVHIPQNSRYVLLTPLATAIDVADRHLQNYGQLKLIAIR